MNPRNFILTTLGVFCGGCLGNTGIAAPTTTITSSGVLSSKGTSRSSTTGLLNQDPTTTNHSMQNENLMRDARSQWEDCSLDRNQRLQDLGEEKR